MASSSQQEYAKNNISNSNPNRLNSLESQGRMQSDQMNDPNSFSQNLSKQGLSTKAKIIIFLIVALAVIAAIVIPITIVLGNQSNDSQQAAYDLCAKDSSQCEGLSDGIRAYISQNFANRDQAMSVAQTAISLNSISPESTQEEKAANYLRIRRSLECMSQTMTPQKQEQTYADLQDLTLDTDQKTDAYLDMNQEASGSPIVSSTDQQAAANCNFEGSSTSRIRNLQLAHQSRVLINQVGAEATGSTCAVYVYQYGLSPCKLLLHLRQWKDTLASRNISRFVAFGLKRRPTTPRCLSEITENFFSTMNGSITDRTRRKWRRGCFDFSNRNQMSVSGAENQSIFLNFYRFIKLRTFQYFQQPQNTPDYSIALDYIRQQINLGMKLVILSHGSSSLYSNEIYKELSAEHKKSCSQICISPISSSIQKGEYITSPSDTYIIYLRQNGFTPLQPNIPAVTFDRSEDMGDQHELSGYVQKCKQEIVQKYTKVQNEIVAGNGTAVDGPITVQLTWNTTADLDLSIVQPDQTIVYHGSPNGTVGILSKYDEEAFEEFYYVPEGQVVVGDYAVRVYYKEGNVTTKTRLTIKGGGMSFYLKEYNLYPSSPVNTIIIIRVTQNPSTGAFNYNFVQSSTPIDEGECDNITKSINVDLSWQDTSADLNLHIIEPTSFVVSAKNLVGDVGTLSENVKHGGGNGQIYQINCENVTAGQYVIAVNYYSGLSKEPITGSITMTAGNNKFEQNITLVAPLGEAGDRVLFWYVGIIYVQKVNGTFSYSFVPWTPECRDSSFQVYVAWDKQSDVDLFVTEPSGFRVDFDNMEGPVGGLMSDANQTYGPEIYKLRCGQLIPGDYIMRLNYLNGSEPIVATVIVRMGTEYLVHFIHLDEAIGQNGTLNPPHKVGIIRVTKDGDVFVFAFAEQIEKECFTESLKVTLTWEGDTNDLDLHIIEPSGFHVYFQNANGTHGNLSEDIQTGGLRETYETGCIGQYVFGINFFSGYKSATGIINITVGNQTQVFQMFLVGAVGWAGDSVIQYYVGKVTVFQVNGTLSYTFVPWAPQCLESFSVYLSWFQAPDIDLSVKQPSGSIVKFDNINGDVGTLVHIGGSAYGPEIYQTRCGKLVDGDYKIVLSTKERNRLLNMIILIRAGTKWYTTYIQQMGSGNPNSGKDVLIVRVSNNGTSFTFDKLI